MISLPLHEARNRLTAIVHEVEEGTPVRLTRHGKPVAVLMDMETLAQLESSEIGFIQRYKRFLEVWKSDYADKAGADSVTDHDSNTEDLFESVRSSEPGRIVEL